MFHRQNQYRLHQSRQLSFDFFSKFLFSFTSVVFSGSSQEKFALKSRKKTDKKKKENKKKTYEKKRQKKKIEKKIKKKEEKGRKI